MAHALSFPSVHQALTLLVTWIDLDTALVLQRAREINGDHYEILTPAADALGHKHPLAATLLPRAMIDFSLKESGVKRYRHAARHLAECASLADVIERFGGVETHDAYVARLQNEHGRKSWFWILVP